jgi:flagellar protein FlaG
MSLDVTGVAGQGSIRPTQTNKSSPPSDTYERFASTVESQSNQSIASKQEMDRQINAQQLQEAAQRNKEKEAVQKASREEIEREVQQALKELKDVNLSFNHKLKYSIDHKQHAVIVKVIDPDTDEVIKELPPVSFQRFHNRLQEFIGLLVDEEA